MTNTSPPLVTRALILRWFTPQDAPKAFAMSREPGVRTWLPDQVYESEAEALRVLRSLIGACRDPGTPSRGPYVLGVCLRDSGELIGHVGLSPLDEQSLEEFGFGDEEVEVGFAIEEEHQGRGFAAEAVGAMSEWALARFALPRILGIAAAENTASCRVLEKAGFRLVEASTHRMHGHSRLVRTYQRAAAPTR